MSVYQKAVTGASVAQAGSYSDAIEVLHQSIVSVQFSKTGAGTSAAAKLQWSNDNATWKDVNTTLYPGATAAIGAGAATIHLVAESIAGAWVRVTFTEGNVGPIVVTIGKWVAKTH